MIEQKSKDGTALDSNHTTSCNIVVSAVDIKLISQVFDDVPKDLVFRYLLNIYSVIV